MVRAVLAATYCCDESDFLGSGIVFTTPGERPGRIRWPVHKLRIGTMGDSVVASCAPEWEEWLRPLLEQQSRDDVFQPTLVSSIIQHLPEDLMLRGPALKYVCTPDSFRPASPIRVEITVVREHDTIDLYRHRGFDDALLYRSDGMIQDRVAAVAWRAEDVLGMAGASDDAESLWQIGVSIAPAEQKRGLGRVLVSCVTEEVLARGVLPYYTTTTANVRSQAVAVSLGYWPVWTELYVRRRDSD